MIYLVVSFTAFFISLISLFSGFGLGTVLMPVFAFFFPIPVAIAASAIVHLANNLFKATLVGRLANWNIVMKFGIPAALTAAIGAMLLKIVSDFPPILSYHEWKVTYVGVIVGFLIVCSSFFILLSQYANIAFKAKYIPIGGALSGLLGGISGHQGFLRSAFLIKANLSKEEFIGTGVICSLIIDTVRLFIYAQNWHTAKPMLGLVTAACVSSFLGAFIGAKMIHKITYKTIESLVGYLLLIVGLAMIAGLI